MRKWFNPVIFFFILIALLLFPKKPVLSKTIIIDDSLSLVHPGYYMEYLEDRKGLLSIEDVLKDNVPGKWKASSEKRPGFGYSNSVFWVKLQVRNSSKEEMEFFLENDYPLIDDIKLFYPMKNGNYGLIATGDLKPFKERPYEHRNFVFPLKLQSGASAVYYLRYKTSGSMNIHLNLWSPSMFLSSTLKDYHMFMIYYGVMLVMIIYNLILFFFVRRMEYLYYALTIFCLVLFTMCLNGTAFQFLWPEIPSLNGISIPMLLTLLWIFSLLFLIDFVELKTNMPVFYKISQGGIVLCSVIFVLVFFLSYNSSLKLALTFSAPGLLFLFVAGITLSIRKIRAAYFFLCSWSLYLIGGMLQLLMSTGIIPANFFTYWSFQIGSAGMVVLLSIALGDRINTMRKEIHIAEKKYRNIVESSNDIIFTLDEELNFLSVNRAALGLLGYSSKSLMGKNFFDCLQDSSSENTRLQRILVEENINELRDTKSSVTFRADFKTLLTHEPCELLVKLEYAEIDGGAVMILGKASAIVDDKIMQFLKHERHIYSTDNYLSNADILSHRLTRNLNKVLKAAHVTAIRIAVREVLVNAIEHGNLNIDFDEKTRSIQENRYLEFLQGRQKDSRYKTRRVLVEYWFDDEKVEYRIADEGYGFDFEKIMGPESTRAAEEMLEHGRGLLIAKNAFDRIVFNEKGNEVQLIKFFNKN